MRELRVAEGELSDEGLLAGMALGEQAAAVTFVRRYQRRVFGLAYSMTGDTGVAEDVAQEAMLRAWRHAPVFDPRRGSVASWVLTITRNLAIEALRLEQRRAVVLAAVYGRTALEISESEGIPLGTAKTRIRTALIRLRVAVEQSEGVSDER